MSRSRVGKAAALGVGLGLLAMAVIASREEAARSAAPQALPSSSSARLPERTVETVVRPVLLRPRETVLARARAEVESTEPEPAEADPPSEARVMKKLRELLGSDPPLSLALAREGNQRFPDSRDAAERAWFEARALVDLQRFAEAQQLARDMGERYPRTSWTDDVQRHLLTHPLGLPAAP